MGKNKIRDRIQTMLLSNEKGMMKLAQRLCHQYRISYWVACQKSFFGNEWKLAIIRLKKIKVEFEGERLIYSGKLKHEIAEIHKIDFKKKKNGSTKVK